MANVYVDFNASTGTLTGTWTFTNTNASVTADGDGDAVNELANGDYIRQSDGIQWYKVTARPDADTITITPTFQQATHTDDVGASLYNDTSVSGALNTDYVHHNQALTDTVRSAGEIVRTRANLTYTYAGVQINIDEDGTVNNPITLKGASIADDPWSDASDVRPIIDFGGTGFSLNISSDNYWTLNHLDFIGSIDSNGPVDIAFSDGITVSDCRIYDNGNGSSDRGLRFSSGAGFRLINCTFFNNFGTSVNILSASGAYLEGCIFDGDPVGGGNGTDIGLAVSAACVFMRDCIFGGTDDHDVADVSVTDALLYGRNVKLDSATEVRNTITPGSLVSLEDNEQTHLAFRNWQFPGNISRSAVVERSGEGGTPWSILGEPNSNCGSERILYLVGDRLRGVPIYLDGTEQTITVYAYATSWAGLPSVTQFVVEIDHIEGAADWDTDVTSDTFAANDQWESFDITLTPNAAGFAYLRVKLLDFEDGTEKIYVDPVPEVDGSRDESLIAATVDGVMAGYEIVASGAGGRQTRGRLHNV